MIVQAVKAFEYGNRQIAIGQTLNVVSVKAEELRQQGLVTWGGEPPINPETAGGLDTLSSASLPAQASPQTISEESNDGEPRRRRKWGEESSSPTPLSE